MFFRNDRDGKLADHFAGAVLGIRFDAQNHNTLVTLGAAEKHFGDLGSLVDADQEKTRREWIESTEMTHFFGRQNIFDPMDDLGGRWAFGFIDQQYPAAAHRHGKSFKEVGIGRKQTRT